MLLYYTYIVLCSSWRHSLQAGAGLVLCTTRQRSGRRLETQQPLPGPVNHAITFPPFGGNDKHQCVPFIFEYHGYTLLDRVEYPRRHTRAPGRVARPGRPSPASTSSWRASLPLILTALSSSKGKGEALRMAGRDQTPLQGRCEVRKSCDFWIWNDDFVESAMHWRDPGNQEVHTE